jgi:hypothetical protein
MGGAVARIPADESAFAHRDTQFFVNLIGIADEEGDTDAMRGSIRALYSRMSRDALPGTLANFGDQDEEDDVRRFGRPNAARLASLRRRFNPAGTLA